MKFVAFKNSYYIEDIYDIYLHQPNKLYIFYNKIKCEKLQAFTSDSRTTLSSSWEKKWSHNFFFSQNEMNSQNKLFNAGIILQIYEATILSSLNYVDAFYRSRIKNVIWNCHMLSWST